MRPVTEPPRPTDARQPDAPDADEEQGEYAALLLRAGYNYHVFLAAIFGFAREHGAGIDEFVAWTAARVAGSWSGLREHGADAVLRVVLENLAATGYAVERVEYGATLSRAAVRAVPLGLDSEGWRTLLEPFGVAPAEMLRLFQIFVPLAHEAGAALEVEDHGGEVRLTVRREPPRPGPQPIRF